MSALLVICQVLEIANQAARRKNEPSAMRRPRRSDRVEGLGAMRESLYHALRR